MTYEHVDVISSLYIKFTPSEWETHKNMQFLPGRYVKWQGYRFAFRRNSTIYFPCYRVSSFRLFML